jgi:hypothetical protein
MVRNVSYPVPGCGQQYQPYICDCPSDGTTHASELYRGAIILDRSRVVVDQATEIAYPGEAADYARCEDARLEFVQV